MKNPIYILALGLLLFGAGCSTVPLTRKTDTTVPIATAALPDTSVTATALAATGKGQNILLAAQIDAALKAGSVIKEINNPNLALPADIDTHQIKKYFQIDTVLFALVLRNSTNVALALTNNFIPSFVGVLVAKQNDTQWTKLVEIKDARESNKNNPYYLLVDRKSLLLTIVDQNGAGSGEGVMKVLALSEINDWTLVNCYRFGGTYQGSIDGDYFAFSGNFSRQTPQPLESCNNAKLILPTQKTAISEDLIRVTSPQSGAVVKSPLAIAGTARGSWFFEASAPVMLLDGNGKEIARGITKPTGDWMTSNFVPFTATLTFSEPETDTGTLVFKNDNPSDLPENSHEVGITVHFSKQSPMTNITFFIAPGTDQHRAYCNGADMDSAGYKKTLTKRVADNFLPGTLSTENKIQATLNMAVSDSNAFSHAYTRIGNTTFGGGIVTMRPAGGFAGVSIFMCAWKPFVEKNLEQFLEIKKIEWLPQS